MGDWQPITKDEFYALYSTQYAELNEEQKKVFDLRKTEPQIATIFRSEMYGTEQVYYVWKDDDVVLYFDDVEYGFNPSRIGPTGRILNPGGSQSTLGEAIDQFILGRKSRFV